MQATTYPLTASPRGNLWARLYRIASLVMAVSFAVVGLIFLFAPAGVLAFFDALSLRLGLPPSASSAGFYLVLAVGYMYLVTLLAGWMFVRPENNTLPVLLINAKAASSLLSFAFFAAREPALIYLANGIVDGLIAVGVVVMYVKRRREA
jgi:hypothetical protein